MPTRQPTLQSETSTEKLILYPAESPDLDKKAKKKKREKVSRGRFVSRHNSCWSARLARAVAGSFVSSPITPLQSEAVMHGSSVTPDEWSVINKNGPKPWRERERGRKGERERERGRKRHGRYLNNVIETKSSKGAKEESWPYKSRRRSPQTKKCLSVKFAESFHET